MLLKNAPIQVRPWVAQHACARLAMGLRVAAFGVGLFLATAIPAAAQQPGSTIQNPPGQVPSGDGNARPDESLSDRLSRSQGVITPPSGVDPGIQVPAPEPDPKTTPVIPAPGTPGGDPNVQPK